MKTIIRERYIHDIPTLEVIPEDNANKPLPLVVYYHGWRNKKELALTQARRLAAKNIRVILPDAMHHGERKMAEISSVPSVTFFSSIQYNIIEFNVIVRYFEERNWIENGKIGVGGYSMGGITTAAIFSQHPEITAAACLMGTPQPTNYAKNIQKNAKEWGYFVPDDLGRIHSWLLDFDLSLRPEVIASRPLFFWHGTEDDRIAYSDSHDFYVSIKDQPYADKVEFHTGQGEGHLITIPLMDQVAHFFHSKLVTT